MSTVLAIDTSTATGRIAIAAGEDAPTGGEDALGELAFITIKTTMAATMKSQVANAFGRACLLILDMASVSGSAIRAVQAQIGKVFARFAQTTGKMPGRDGFP